MGQGRRGIARHKRPALKALGASMYWPMPELSQGGGEGMLWKAQLLHSALLLMKPMTVFGTGWAKLGAYALETEFQ